jgi:hypothetical protein
LLAPHHFRRRIPRSTSTDDHNLLRCRAHGLTPQFRFGLGEFFPHDDQTIPLFHGTDGNWAQGGRAQGFTRAQVKTCVVPGAAHGVADHQSFGEWTIVMTAMSSHCEILGATPRQQHLVLADKTGNHLAIGDLVIGDAECQISSGGFGLINH